MKFCIPKPTVEKMKEAVRSGEISIQNLYDSTSESRRKLFEQYASRELAQEINAGFEKAMISKQKGALTGWAQAIFTAKEKKESNYRNVLDKINELEKIGVLNDSNADNFLYDLVADKLGISVTAEEVKNITGKAEALESLYNQSTEDGIPPVEYWTARRDMEKYLNSLTPNARLKVATSISGRGAMLLSFKSPLVNIISNTVQGFFEGFQRRIANNTYKGLNGEFALSYVKKVNDIYQQSGYDISRMETLSQGQRRLGEQISHAEGPGMVRAVGRWYEDIVFKQLMGAPDVVSSSIAFADSVNLSTTKIAYIEGLTGEQAKTRALEIFKDAILIKPLTIHGEIARSQGIADAQYSTFTHKSGYSDLAMAIRTALNNATGNVRLGDQLMPFVKTPANVVQVGVDAAGIGAFRGFFKLPEAMRQLKAGNSGPMQDTVRLFVRSGLGLTLATVLSFMFDPEDYVGEYDSLSQKERDLARLKNASFNSVKVGDKYISLDYLGPIGSAFVGIMYARKYGDTLPEKIFQYAKGAGTQALKLPGLREFSDLVTDINEATERGDLGDVAKGLTDEAVAYIRARTIPAIVNDFAKATDEKERKTGKEQLSKLRASLPVLRQELPERVNLTTGETLKGEGFISTLLFGNRVKTASDNAVVKEIDRLYNAGEGPTISDIEYASKRVKELKVQLPEKRYEEAIKFYGKTYAKYASETINSDDYKNGNDDEKRQFLNDDRRTALEDMLEEFGYKDPKDKT